MIDVPGELAASQQKFNGAAGRAFIAGLPRRAADFLERWELRVDGPSMYGVCALVLPVLRADGTRAALKLQPLDEESAGEPVALRRWDGDLLPAIRWRFDAMTEVLALDRERARAWSLARVLQNTLWDIADGRPLEPVQREIGRWLREH
ncbi:hypothetical protein ABZ455_00475 [Streptomyces avermitilis]